MKRLTIPFALSVVALSLAACSIVIPGRSSSSGSSSTSTSTGTGTSSGITSSQSATSAASSVLGDYDLVVTFTTSGTGAVGSGDTIFEYVGDGISRVTGSSLYHNNGPIRLGTRSGTGQFGLEFDKGYCLSKFVIDASAYSSDSDVPLALTLGDSISGGTRYLNERGSYEFDVSSVNQEVASFNLATTTKGKRANLYRLYISYGEVTPVYPTSIAFSSASYRVAEGKTKSTSLEFTPSGANVKEVTYESGDQNVFTVDNDGKITGVAEGTATLTATAKAADNQTITATAEIEVYESSGIERTEIKQHYGDLQDNNFYYLDSCPSVGNPKLLIIPVWFSDSSSFITSSKKAQVRSDIENAYLGTASSTGWHSVKSFYAEESQGLLTLDGTVTDWYDTKKSYTSFGSSTSGDDATNSLVVEASDWYFENNPSDSRKNYDSDGDGYLDGVMLIYAAPDYYAMNKSSYSNLWAYCYWIQDPRAKSVANPGANVFFWASYDFMYGSNASSRSGSSYSSGDTSHCTIDAHTFIHEMGHVFGLDDYYDYGPNKYNPAGAFSMQDYNRGGHDPYSCLALGWADPYIPEDSCDITIGAFQKTHETILLSPSWNQFDSPFDEYLLLELYTPTGLNKFDCDYAYEGNSKFKGPSGTGIRLWHVNASMVYVNGDSYGTKGGNIDFISDCRHTGDGVQQAFSNSVGDEDYGSVLGSSYDDYNLLHLIRNSTSEALHPTSVLSNSSLFGDGASFTMSKYKSQFANSTKLDLGKTLGWSFTVSISGTGDSAQATISLTRA